MVIEYKAPHIPLSQDVVDQVFRYNAVLHVPCIIICNGREYQGYRVGYDSIPTITMREPTYSELVAMAD